MWIWEGGVSQAGVSQSWRGREWHREARGCSERGRLEVEKGRGNPSLPPLPGLGNSSQFTSAGMKATATVRLPLLAASSIGAGCDFHSCFSCVPYTFLQITFSILGVVCFVFFSLTR